MHSPILTIARKDAVDATRDRFLQTVTAFLVVAVVVSVVAGAIALASDVATYAAAHDQLLALGKPASAIAAPEFYPLKLLRGAIEQIEIMGAVIALLAGYRAAAAERGRQTLALILTRPLQHWQSWRPSCWAGRSRGAVAAGGLCRGHASAGRPCGGRPVGRRSGTRRDHLGCCIGLCGGGFTPCPSGFACGHANLPTGSSTALRSG